jgi:hypothetical protein
VSGEILLWQKFCGKLAEELDCLSIDDAVLESVKSLKRKNAALRKQLDRMCAPVTDAERLRFFHRYDNGGYKLMTASDVSIDLMIAARKEQGK